MITDEKSRSLSKKLQEIKTITKKINNYMKESLTSQKSDSITNKEVQGGIHAKTMPPIERSQYDLRAQEIPLFRPKMFAASGD